MHSPDPSGAARRAVCFTAWMLEAAAQVRAARSQAERTNHRITWFVWARKLLKMGVRKSDLRIALSLLGPNEEGG